MRRLLLFVCAASLIPMCLVGCGGGDDTSDEPDPTSDISESSDETNAIPVLPDPDPAPSETFVAPTLLSPAAGVVLVVDEEYVFDWTDVPGADHYVVVFRTTTPNVIWLLYYPESSQHAFTPTKIDTWEWAVWAVDADGKTTEITPWRTFEVFTNIILI